ncbi:MAG: lysophospholipid acyltransferase family protein [Kiritimatiellia bacterium]
MRYRLKHWLEYGIVCFWVGVFRLLPYRGALLIGWVAAWFGHYLVRYRRNIVYARIRQVFPDLPPSRVRAIAWLSWRNLVFNVIDTLRVSKMDTVWLQRHVVDCDEVYRGFASAGIPAHGLVAVSMHMGCAEIAARMLQQVAARVFVIFKTQKNLLVDRKLHAMRGATGIACLPVGDGVYRQILRRLRDHETLAMLADLRVDDGGVLVDFLGHKASVGAGAALFARRAGVSLLVAVFGRIGWCKHRVAIKMILVPDMSLSVEADVQRMMQIVFTEFDRAIRAQPEQWFWYNKKWILG